MGKFDWKSDMAVKIRLTRTGARNDVCYRVVAADSRSPRDGRFIEVLGWYDPKLEGINFKLRDDRIQHWREQGAEISDTVKSLLKKARRAAEEPGEETAEPTETAPEVPAEPVAEAAEDEAWEPEKEAGEQAVTEPAPEASDVQVDGPAAGTSAEQADEPEEKPAKRPAEG